MLLGRLQLVAGSCLAVAFALTPAGARADVGRHA